jgi:hypothetical protein
MRELRESFVTEHPPEQERQQLVLEVAIPDFYLADITQEVADEFFEGDFLAMLYAELRIASPNIEFDLELMGDKDGVTETVKGRIIGAKVAEADD